MGLPVGGCISQVAQSSVLAWHANTGRLWAAKTSARRQQHRGEHYMGSGWTLGFFERVLMWFGHSLIGAHCMVFERSKNAKR